MTAAAATRVWSDDGGIAMICKQKSDLGEEFVALPGQVEQKS